MTQNDELVEELRNLKLRLTKETIELQSRKEAYDEQVREVKDLRKAIEEVLEEIELGRTDRPLIDAAHAQAGRGQQGEPRPIGPGDLAAVREQVEEQEGPAGDGSRTRICLRCRAGFPIDHECCPRCAYRITRVAIGILDDLAPRPEKPRASRKAAPSQT